MLIYKQVIALLLCSLLSTGVHAVLRIETTTQDLAAIAKSIGGDHVEVHSLTIGSRDPHFAVAKPSMIRRVYRADLLLVIGVDMEIGWLPALLQASRNTQVQPGSSGYLDLSTAVNLLGKMHGVVTRDMGDVHAKGNPHYWLDPRNGILMAQAMSERLSQLDPQHATDYRANFSAFEKKIKEKMPQWRAELKALNGQSVIAYHSSFVYLADAFGFRLVDEVEPKPGISPSAASLNALITRIKKEQIELLIMAPYYERRSARYLNEQTAIQIAVLPQSVGAEKEIKHYSDLFDALVKRLKSAGVK